MVENRSSLFGILALIIGASGLGLGTYSVVSFQVVEGPQGPPGDDGQDIVGLQVGILDPDHLEIVSGVVEVRILLWNSSECSINVFINGSINATSVPWAWNTSKVSDGWWNVSVRVMDTESNVARDEVMVYVLNNPDPTPRAKVADVSDQGFYIGFHLIDFNAKNYDSTGSFNLTTDRYDVPESGYYLVTASTLLLIHGAMGGIGFYQGELQIRIQMGAIISLTRFTEHLYDTIDWTYFSLITTDVAYFSEGDQIQVNLAITYAGVLEGPIGLIGGSENTFFTIAKLSD